MKLRYQIIALAFFPLGSCSSPCVTCEVLKNDEMIEKYEGCEEESIQFAKEICIEMAKMQDSECVCSDD